MSRPAKISALWVVVMINMAFADILSLYAPGMIDQVASSTIEGITITPAFLLLAAVFIEIGIVMIVLTHVLSPRLSRILNLVAVVVTAAFVIGGGSLLPHYVFFASIEVIALIWIATLAWSWRESAPALQAA